MIYKNSSYPPSFAPNGDDHGVVVVWVDVSCIILEEDDFGFICLYFSSIHLNKEVFYIKYSESVPYVDEAGMSASDETSCEGIQRMAHNLFILSGGSFFSFS